MSIKLTRDIIKSRANEDKLETIKTLNLWGNKLDDISLLKELPSLEILSLSSNHIYDLSVFQNLKNIKELYLRENLINDFKQIEYLKYCKKLEILSLTDNPIVNQPNYRQKILEILPQLKKLDEQDNILDKNPPPPSSFGLFKKIFPKRTNINDKIKNENNENINMNKNIISSYTSKKNDMLNKSFQKKKTIGTFRKTNNKKDGNLNLELSVDLSKNPMSLKNPEKLNNNLANKQGANDYKKNSNLTDSNIANKYNKKIAGNFKKERCTLFKYQEFDEPKNSSQKTENKLNKQKNENNKTNNKNNNIKNEETVMKSIKLLLETLNKKELNIINDEIKKMIEKQNK